MAFSGRDISVADTKDRTLRNLETHPARQPQYATRNDWYTALALAVREPQSPSRSRVPLRRPRMGNFSSDRAIREYDEKIWRS
jgi:glucan phosphorylase